MKGRRPDPAPLDLTELGFVRIQDMILYHGWNHARLADAFQVDERTVLRLAAEERQGKSNPARQRTCFLLLKYQTSKPL